MSVGASKKGDSLATMTEKFMQAEKILRAGGGKSGKERQRRLGRLTVRERLKHLLDPKTPFFELSLWAGFNMYPEWGDLPAAGVVTGIGKISGRRCMIVANDATVKAGAFFPQSVKKVLRAQRIAFENRLPVIFLVDSSGVFLPLQDEVFPDEDDFGRIFRNNALFSAAGIPQIGAIMGSCIAGGGYLPVLCDKLLMTKGSGLYLAGPALVKASIGQIVDPELLGGAAMHAEISGTVDFVEDDDFSCLKRIRDLVAMQQPDPQMLFPSLSSEFKTALKPEEIYRIVSPDNKKAYDVRDLLACIVDSASFIEYKASYGKTLVAGYAKIGGASIGIVANQRLHATTGKGEVEIGGVIYAESSDKAARFVMDCNQLKIPLVFFQDVMGFMVGKNAEQSGIIRKGAKLISAISNSVVPKITCLVGNSFGAGHYALCGRAYDPNFIMAWPNAKYGVMGADQAAETLWRVQEKKIADLGSVVEAKERRFILDEIKSKYEAQSNIYYAAARGWIDAVIEPKKTRAILIELLQCVQRAPPSQKRFHTGVFQV